MPFLMLWSNQNVYYLATVCLTNRVVTFLALVETTPTEEVVTDLSISTVLAESGVVTSVLLGETLIDIGFSDLIPRNYIR